MDMNLGLENKVVLLTGASSGIGRAAARAFYSHGTRVALLGRRKERLLQTAAEMDPQRYMAVEAHIEQESETQAAIDAVISRWDRMDILVNAAGIIGFGSLETEGIEQWDRMLSVNLRAPFLLMKQALPHLIAVQGTIVNVSSVNGERAFPNVLSYCVSKAGLDHLTRCAALELAPKGVRINAVNPGVVITELHRTAGLDSENYRKFLEHSKSTHPMGRVGQPEEVADLILFLASPRSGWITGTTCSIDGGRHLTCFR
jgi:NAD(P)-dependent dehydrogenase (short-subunit alcohol dehydrogenase family)